MTDSYYGKPIVKPHPWKWYIPVYFWFGGLAGASSLQTLAARASGNDELARNSKLVALAAIAISPVLLIADLGRPERFLNMLRVFKPTSPMSVGTWILSGFGAAIAAATLAELLGARRLAIAGEIGAGLLGAPLAVYTAVLISDTATPVWQAAYKTLPFAFASSAVCAAGAVGAAVTSEREGRLARRLMIAGALALAVSATVMERRLGPLLSEPYRHGEAHAFHLASNALAIAGAALGLAAGSNRWVLRAASVCVAGAGLCERFAVTAAGTASALDPKYVVIPQRAHLAKN